jgi:KUP system potassium uptake protein
MTQKDSQSYFLKLVLGAIGVVYGDIGTSPLYTIRECFHGVHRFEAARENVLGVLSLALWSITLIVSIKYLGFVLRAHNKGEGGILALLPLAFPMREGVSKRRALVITLGVFGAALLYGDGMITPAITVLSAVEGLKVATPFFEPYIIPIAIAILIGLFSFQHHGSGGVGRIFGPVMIIWFISLGVLGVRGIVSDPHVLVAINPLYALKFFLTNGWHGFVVLGSVFLAVTGAEALYADMGHFGTRAIRRAWFMLVFPALILNYFGQGALVLQNPTAVENPFFLLAPRWALYPLVLLATFAAIIASQAMITGAFSLTMQGIQLGYIPRMEIRHTSHLERGQIYLPFVNWALMIACVGLVLGFRSSSHLAGAYGIAVSLTFIITTAFFLFAAQHLWQWPWWKAAGISAIFLVPELAFVASNALKITHGGWFPLVVGIGLYTLMVTWKTGRVLIREKMRAGFLPFDLFLEDLKNNPPHRVKGTAIFLSGNAQGAPIALLHNIKHNKVLHERVAILTIVTDEIPHVPVERRLTIEKLAEDFFRVIGHYGFMEEPDVPELLELCGQQGLEFKPMESTFFLSRETIIATPSPGMAIWRERLFALMSRNAQRPTTFFRLPANRVVELGIQVEL